MVQAFIVGGTGEVGKPLLKELLASSSYSAVVAFARHPIDYTGPGKEKLRTEVVPDFDNIQQHAKALKGCTVGLCTLGSTRAKAGSAEAFEKIDYGYTMKIAEMAKTAGCQWFGVVTSAGANAKSSLLYPRVKGMIERDLTALKLPALAIFKPGFLLCDRSEKRTLETVGGFLARGVNWAVPDRFAIKTEDVAKAMLRESETWIKAKNRAEPTIKVYDNKVMVNIAK